ncbi:MAG: DUF5702 domain-containing protein [Roseburia sp.]|uniref:DUF5702 domain-containing protein n=1 Tax=Roseburia sp. 831b TaxID=1261635 RepID=UPI00095334B9|nr:DUF5702 domain-containing protein [Roseburia sp. 831b]MCI5919316.1 DUF5702 domain-containing protein [Roseburia sp.]MDD6216034.1 DUF5702 domain-containing protein [Roseburia sp.]WVK72508.1 DUF5702 domain-containing protein [Roseburia sp. 831b]
MKKGSITIFASLSMMLVASFLFAMLESARYYGLQTYIKQKSPLITESVFAEYNAKLWEDYHLLFLDGAYGGTEFSTSKVAGRASQIAKNNLTAPYSNELWREQDLFQLNLDEVSVESYALATDCGGDFFLAQVTNYMKQNIPVESAKAIYDRIETSRDKEEEGESANLTIEEANNLLNGEAEEAEKGTKTEKETKAEKEAKTEKEVKTETGSEAQNPMEHVLQIKENAILGTVVEDTSKLSECSIPQNQSLLERDCEKGNKAYENQSDWYEKILLELYLKTYFSSYTNPMEGRALSYELEYIVGGKQSDRENLEQMVERLMLVREAANVASLLSDTKKVAEAETLALAVAGFTGNPAVVKTVQIGIVGAWAYIESILDVRTLLQGGKISLIKSKTEWTSELLNMVSLVTENAKAKECKNGCTYTDYLLQFLFFMKEREQAFRAMDLMEHNLQLEQMYQNSRMDHMIVAADFQYRYATQPLFWKLITIGGGNFSYQCQKTESFSYLYE